MNLNIDMNAPVFVKPQRPAIGKNLKMPNIKSLFKPDPGYIAADADLAQADARVVAWEANDTELMDMFEDPTVDLHTENAKTIFGSCPTKDHPNRKKAKAGVHAVNYNVYPNTLAVALGCTVLEAEFFIKRWFAAHPAIKDWHARVHHQMMNEKRIANRFGFGKNFFGSLDHGTALSEALAWIPQSTVGIIINKVWACMDANVDESLCSVKMQVHDSLCFQIRETELHVAAPQINAQFKSVVVPYDRPLNIAATLGIGTNYGELDDITWDGWLIDPKSGLATDKRTTFWQGAA